MKHGSYQFFFVAAIFLLCGPARAGQTVVDAGTTNPFTVSAVSTNYAWRLDGTLVSSNGIVGTNGPAFAYTPQRFDVGTHLLACCQTLSNGATSNTLWQVRVRILLPATGTNYYVATTGSDTNAGTLAAPFLTLDRARKAVTNLARPLPPGGVTVWLRGGTYFRTNTLMLTNVNDFGTATAPIVYRSFANEIAVISGGTAINAGAFTNLSASVTNRVTSGVNPTNLLEMDLTNATYGYAITHAASFPAKFNWWTTYDTYAPNYDGGLCELIYNGQRMFLSRYPNHDPANDDLLTANLLMDGVAAGLMTNKTVTLTTGDSTNSLSYGGIYTNSAGVTVSVGGAFYCKTNDSARFTRWQSAITNGGLWLQGYWAVPWQIDGLQVLAFDVTNRVVELTNTAQATAGLGDYFTRPAGNKAEKYWALNLLEEIDQPGEWAVDFKRNKIYFYPPGPLTNGSVVISDFASPLVQIGNGSNLVFQSLTFEAGLSQGILITNGLNNLVLGCEFRNMNNYAMDINSGGTNGVVDCFLHELAAGGVILRGGYETNNAALRVPARDFVVNNIVTNFGRVMRVYAPAVDAGFYAGSGSGGGGGHVPSVGMRVAHNNLSVSPHCAVLLGSWDSTFEYNDIGRYQQVSEDLGAFYSYDYFWRHGNHTFRYNFLHDSPLGNGIDFDQDHPQMHIYGNVISLNTTNSYSVGSQTAGDGIRYQNGTQATNGNQQAIECYNNLTVNCHWGGIFTALLPSVIEENAAIVCSNNFVWTQVVAGSPNNSFVSSSAAAMQSGPNFSYAADPGFINLANNDFRLVPNAPLYTDMPRFAQIPFEMIGLYNDETWSNAPGYCPYVVTTNATAVTCSNAVANGWLYYPQFDSNTTATVYFGTADGGSNPLAWQASTNAGIFAAGLIGGTVGPLTNGTTYYFRFLATNAFGSMWSPVSFMLRTQPSPSSPVPVITNVTPSQVALQNSTLTLTGKVVYPTGPVYPNPGDPVSVTTGGVTQNGVIADSIGDFSISFNTAGLPPSGSPYLITYIYAGNTNLNTATNTATTVTLNPLPQPVFTVASAAVVAGKIAPLTGQISSPGPVYPASGETVGITINGPTQYGTVTNNAGNFLVNFDSTGLAISTNPYPATYFYPGNTSLNNATNTATTLTVCPPNFFWTGTAGTNFETGGGGGNWANYAPPVSDLFSATAIFSNTPPANQPSLTASRSISGLLFPTATGGWTLGTGSASNLLAVGFNGISTVGQSSGTNRITASLNVAASQTWQADTGGTLLFTGSITNASPGTNYSLLVNASGSAGNVIFSPAAGNSVSLTSSNPAASVLQVKNGGVLALGGDGTNAPLTSSTNQIISLTTNAYSSLGLAAPGKIQVNSGTWILSDLGNNGGDKFTGALEVDGGVISFGGARYLGEGSIQVNGGELRIGVDATTHYINGGRFSPGNYYSISPTNVAVVNVTGGLVNLATAPGIYGGNCIGMGLCTLFNQSGGTVQNSVIAGTGGSTTTFCIGGLHNSSGIQDTNNLTAYTITGGVFISAGTVLAQNAAGPGSVNDFNFMGGTLAVSSFNATSLGSSPAATASASQTSVSLALGTLVNYGGTLAPGNVGIPGKTTITGNYAVSNNAAALAIDIGGTTPATAFTNAPNNYDFVAITGTVALGGSLKVGLLNGLTPAANNAFTILTASGGLSGAFNNLISNRVAVTGNPTYSFLVVTTATSVILTNYLQSAPLVTISPAATNITFGKNMPLTASATGLVPLAYQWFDRNTNAIAGATTVTLTLTNPAVAASGNYTIIVTNVYGSATNFAAVTVAATNLTVTAGNDTKVYGQTRTYGPGSGNFTTSAMPDGETVGSVTITAAGGTNATDTTASYTLTPSAATGGTFNPANYNIAYNPGLLTVNPATPVLTLTASAITYGQALGSSSLSGSGATNGNNGAAVNGTFVFATPSILPRAGGTNATVNFTPIDTTNYNPTSSTVAVAVNKATPVLQAPAASAICVGSPFSASSLSGGAATNSFNNAAVAGTFSFANPSFVPGVGVTNVTVNFLPVDTTNYNVSPTTVAVTVKTTVPVITLHGSNPLIVECHGGFTDPGATATNACSGPLVVRAGGSVDTTAPGAYTLTYTADDGNGTTNSATRDVDVVDTTPPAITQCASPQTLVAGTNGTIPAPNLTNALVASDSCSAVLHCSQSPVAGTPLPVGTNTIVIAVDDGNGNTNTCSTTVTVLPPPPVAGFTAAPTSGAFPLTVTFTDTSTGSITSRAWIFGDGSTTNTLTTSLTHNYTGAGTNLVMLTVSGPGGTNCTSMTIVVVASTSQPPLLTGIQLIGNNVILTGTNGTAGSNFYLVATPDLAQPATNWTILSTNQFGPGGGANTTNPLNPNLPQNFYRLRLP